MRFRSSGTRQAFASQDSTPLVLALLGRHVVCRRFVGLDGLDVVVEVGGDRLARLYLRLALDGLAAQPGDRSARGLDLRARGLREAMRRDGQLLGQLTG